ncbi:MULTISPECIES: non-ribosomal peptide synthetase [Actinomadura]|uniref:Phenyloxazoline synthase MbtB n=1 Tax=Actinomadura yumaensis TaxID=111807 RepID=A0ABW2CEW3_9ACTN|nr:non-ribosomal peptide synthetase [Actinomadura sp. J1-007]
MSTPARRSVFPLTAVQEAYWVGRQDTQPLGGVACHMYFEFEGALLEPARLERAVRAVAGRHPMLRARFTDSGEQYFASSAAWPGLTVHDLSRLDSCDLRRELARIRSGMAHRLLDVERGQVFDVRLCLLADGRTRLHVDVDHLVADPVSIRMLLADLAAAYDGTLEAAENPLFAVHAAARPVHDEDAHAARDHWRERLPGGTARPPRLPLAAEPATVAGAHFTRRGTLLPAHKWRRLRARAREHAVEPESVLLAAYAQTLGRWSAEPAFSISVPSFPRPDAPPDMSRAVGDFTALTFVPFTVERFDDLAELARAVDRERREAAPHSAYSAVRALREPGPGDAALSFEGAAVFTSLIEREWPDRRVVRVLGEPVWALTETPQALVDFQVYARDGGVHLAWDAPEEIFQPGVLDAMVEAAQDLLENYADGEWKRPVPAALPAPQAATRARVNATERPMSGRPLHQPVFERAAESPREPALVGPGGAMSRGELSERARRVASALISRGLEPGDAVAVSLPRGPDQVVAVLGVLAAGGCYVPVGVDHPQARRELMYRTAGTRLLIGAEPSASEAADGPQLLTPAAARGCPPLPSPVPRATSSLAYVIFTSGSTGTPKGVEVEHASAANTVEDINDRWSVGPSDRGVTVSALDFDLSVYDVFGLLGAGGSLLVLDDAVLREPRDWPRTLARHRVTVWNSVPVLLDMLLAACEDARRPPPDLRLVVTGGDWIGLDLPGRLHDLLPSAVFVASGGATEASIYSNHLEVERADPQWRSIPYGLPLSNQRFRIVDAAGRDCPDWVPGELWIGGAGVVRGYRGDPERTAARFVAHRGGRWYRTGDRARYRTGGLVEFLGRDDLQVKINGYRIELGEVEAVLAAHPQVAHAVAVVTGTGAARQITAFVTAARDDIDLALLREHAAAHQPEYARPSRYFVLPELPLTSNGKVDRRALARWSAPAPVSPSNEPPSGDLERGVAEEWHKLLGRPVTVRDVGFFELGGNSVLSMRLIRALEKRFGRRLDMRSLLSEPTVAAMASALRDRRRVG